MTIEQSLACDLLTYVSTVANALLAVTEPEVLSPQLAHTLGERLRIVANVLRPLLEEQAAAHIQAMLPPSGDIL
jgi:hypothetical protein